MAEHGIPVDLNREENECDAEEEDDEFGRELETAIEASLDDYALQLQLEEVIAFSDALYASELQLEEARAASESAFAGSSSNSNPSGSSTPENDDRTQDGVGKRLRSGRILVPSPKRARRTGKELVEGDEDAPLVKESCSICLEDKGPSEIFENIACSHRFCSNCIVLHIHSKLQEKLATIHCPEPNCSEHLSPQQCELILPKQTLEEWCLALVETEIPRSQRFYCPYKDCSALLLKDIVPEVGSSTGAATAVIKESECPECKRLFCVQCGVPWHVGLDCSELEKLLPSEKEKDDLMLFKLAKEKEWQRCEKCGQIVEKMYGCCHMTCRKSKVRCLCIESTRRAETYSGWCCFRCGYQFCYKCGSEWKNDRVPCKCIGWEEE